MSVGTRNSLHISCLRAQLNDDNQIILLILKVNIRIFFIVSCAQDPVVVE